jgi:hypothetical protein
MNLDLIHLDKNNNIPYYKVTNTDIKKAKKIYRHNFKNNNLLNEKTVYDREDSRIAGILGEIVFKNIYPKAIESSNDYTYDFRIDNLFIDVKCKCRNVCPRLYFEASIYSYQLYNKSYATNTYYFMSTTKNFDKIWLCGFTTKQKIIKNSNTKVWKAGSADDSNGMIFKKDTATIRYKYLNRVRFQ